MLWKPDTEVDALRKRPKWLEFHREAGTKYLYFDRPVKQGRGYTCVAFTLKRNDTGGWNSYHLADGQGHTALDAMADAYAKSGKRNDELDALWDVVCGRVAETADDFDSLFD